MLRIRCEALLLTASLSTRVVPSKANRPQPKGHINKRAQAPSPENTPNRPKKTLGLWVLLLRPRANNGATLLPYTRILM